MSANKPGSLSARIPFKDLIRAAREYVLPKISIVVAAAVIIAMLASAVTSLPHVVDV